MTSSLITIRIIAPLHCPVLFISLGSRAELRIKILRGILPTSCLCCPIMNTIYQLDLQKIFYGAINSQQHASSTCYVSGTTPSTILSVLAPLIITILRGRYITIILPSSAHMNTGAESLMNLSKIRARKCQ